MTQTIVATCNHLALLADYHTPDMHAHLCSHFALAKCGTLRCVTENEMFEAAGAFIGSNVLHTIECDSPMLIYFFDETSVLGAQIRTRYLPESSAAAAPLEVSSAARACLEGFLAEPNPQAFDQQFLEILLGSETAAKLLGAMAMGEGFAAAGASSAATGDKFAAAGASSAAASGDSATTDPRIVDALVFLQEQKEISRDTIDQLAAHVCLSKSRLSHLFTQEMGVSLHRYLAFARMKKAAEYIAQGSSLTDAAMRAGFDSPSDAHNLIAHP